MAHLGLIKGAVTPLGVLNDCAEGVEVLMDEDLRGRPRLGVHPCDNTETLWISAADIEKIDQIARQQPEVHKNITNCGGGNPAFFMRTP